MKQLFLMVVLVAIALSATAQTQRIVKTVADGSDLNTVLADERYLFDGFKEAQVFLKNSAITKAMMNYNLFSGEMMFIDKGGDTLVLVNISDISAILIDKHLFKKVSKHFYEVMASDMESETELLVRRFIEDSAPVKYGAYGIASPTAAIDNKSTVLLGNQSMVGIVDKNTSPSSANIPISVNKEIRFQRKDIYTLAQDDKIRTADKKGFLKNFPRQTKAIENYLEKAPVDFKDEQDILRLYNYCVDLYNQKGK